MSDSLHVGITGTRHLLTVPQHAALSQALLSVVPEGAEPALHHGVCTGADESAHRIARAEEPPWRVCGHPGHGADGKSPWRSREAEAALMLADDCVLHPSRRYHLRNRDISAACSVLVACPAYPENDPRSARSGTWQTVRDARSRQRRVILVWPDGSTEDDRDAETFLRARIPPEPGDDD